MAVPYLLSIIVLLVNLSRHKDGSGLAFKQLSVFLASLHVFSKNLINLNLDLWEEECLSSQVALLLEYSLVYVLSKMKTKFHYRFGLMLEVGLHTLGELCFMLLDSQNDAFLENLICVATVIIFSILLS